MTTINDGGPAFPVPIAATVNVHGEPQVFDSTDRCYGGMSLRDWFAGQAMAGIMARSDDSIYDKNGEESVENWRNRMRMLDALYAYAVADAMIAAREVKHEA